MMQMFLKNICVYLSKDKCDTILPVCHNIIYFTCLAVLYCHLITHLLHKLQRCEEEYNWMLLDGIFKMPCIVVGNVFNATRFIKKIFVGKYQPKMITL